MKSMLIGVVCSVLAIGAFAQDKPLRAIAYVNGPGSSIHGNITFTQNKCGEAVLIEVSVVGLPPGTHGFHVHEKGDLSGGCGSTGAHFNPDKLDHGGPNDAVRHVGDLGNVNADESGVALTKFSDSLISLGGLKGIIGRGLVIHEKPDDFGRSNHPDSKKTGNAGGRIACGVIGTLSDDFRTCSSAADIQVSVLIIVAVTAFGFIRPVFLH